MLDDNFRLIHEKHAPLHSCRVPINRNGPWYNAMKSDIATRKHRHCAERQYLIYPTILNKQQFNNAKNSMVKIIQKAKSKFYLSEIYSAASKKSLFAICNRLLGLKIGSFSIYIYLIDQLPAIFNEFFIDKVKQIRTNIDQHKLQTQNSTIAQTSLTIFDSFHPITITQLHTIIKSSKPTSCALDPIPTSLLLECLDYMLPTLIHIINTSILSGQFPTNMKTTIVKPLLKNIFRYKQI